MRLLLKYQESVGITDKVILELTPKEFHAIRRALEFTVDDNPTAFDDINVLHNHFTDAIAAAKRQRIKLKEVGHG